MFHQRLLLEEYAVQLKFIRGIKNETADMLSRSYLVYELIESVSTEAFEPMIYEKHANEMVVPVDNDTIYLHQRNKIELENFRPHATTTANYDRTILWIKKGDDERYRI